MLIDFRDKGQEGEREGNIKVKRNIDWLPLLCVQTRDQTSNLGMCPNYESNPQPFGLWDDTEPIEPH